MDNLLDTSFIPQQPLLKVEGSSRRRESINLALLLSLVIFLTAVVVSAGMYFYKANIDKRIITLEKQLESKEASLKISDIDRYKSIDARMAIAKKLLQSHTAFSTILTLLEEITAKNVGWTSLSYGTDESTGLITLDLHGEAPSYSAVYAQGQAWRTLSPTLRGVEMSVPALNSATGIVTFGAKLSVDPSYTNYARLIKGEEAPGGETTTASTTPSSTTP